ncbi:MULTISPECIES: DNA mismatch repair endonuclease MutL [Bacteroides]|uniref:DNA mismatch repair protein MutL n=3 Tax=Bacteroides nordii TaxID=291645 RepID=I8X386_9BACE|nr:DNA mismatch repair endonuclease MutL [Bacteroides nordii]EIY44582.1 DNA mismatch repair protein mutL [Bacteroides nordii CL02T12C05]MCE8465343.1 DNA mismatch repair endonuclease MutL [Bacteroides nordii]MCG4769275.1 DNA mismatch repair endonuclease MutL [Bacteroides nordii]RHB33454.1 DNA mismatch repair endonuclease MutL [Bacteroides nordii]UYU51004.1 DNA mismatch repair endonuclease MutL [Bacteroides nordii]
MSDIIHLLPDSVANQIAAGEVIQRPASVIKELVENAIDAEACNIHVLVTDAGKTCIQVIDDGKGMSETDARLSFERHATSKIREASDLFALRTMGFRGEALASIAAVAQVELKTRLEAEELGTKLAIAGSKVESQEAVSCPKGSNFSIKNLFFNIPARRKFLKANSTELSNILTEFERIALVHPEVAFSLYSNDSELFNLPVSSLRQRILAVFGKKLNQQLLSVDVNTTMIKISGYVAKPETARKKGAHQYFFVNGRYMRHPYFHKAVMDAYEQLIPIGEQISYFLYFEVDPANIDVNIHPTKTEIKFENEQAIWQIISAAVKESLGKFNAVPSIDFDTEDMPDIPAFEQNLPPEPPRVQYNSDFNPFKTSSSGSGGGVTGYSRQKVEWEDLYGGLEKASKMNRPVINEPEAEPDYFSPAEPEAPAVVPSTLYANESIVEKGNLHLQFKGRFILTSVKSGLMLIDQHRAHIRVLFDRYMMQIRQKQGMSQGVLFPEILQLPVSEAAVLQSIMDDLSAVGFELSDLGGGSYAINGIPAGIEGLNPVELVRSMLHTAMEKGNDVKEEVQSILALTLSRAAAIVYGQVLSNEEMVNLVDNLFACVAPNYTPDGKVVLSTIKEEEIEKLFR